MMVAINSFERIASSVASLSKSEAKRQLLQFKGRFQFDFTETYLDSLSTDKIRHVLFAAMVTKARKRA